MYTILHLEQSDFIRNMVKSILTEKGFNYLSVNSAKEAYDILEKEEINLIITSMLISDENIETFMKTINNSESRDIPVFVVTGNDLAEDKKRVLNLGVSDYITKENLANELLKHVEVIAKEDELMESLKQARIAAIDDSKFDINVLKDILSRHGILNVDYYSSSKELNDSGKKYDVYLIDMVLEKEFGKNVVVQLRRNNINSTIIIVSSLTNTKTLSSILNAGANDYIRKPIQEDIFIAKLKSNIRTYRLRKEVDRLMKQALGMDKK